MSLSEVIVWCVFFMAPVLAYLVTCVSIYENYAEVSMKIIQTFILIARCQSNYGIFFRDHGEAEVLTACKGAPTLV